MDKYFLDRDKEFSYDVFCERCDTAVSFPLGSHDGAVKTCSKCGREVELRHAIGVLCRHCLRSVDARERDVGSDFTCPNCGATFVLTLNDIDFTDGQMVWAYPDLAGCTINPKQTP